MNFSEALEKLKEGKKVRRKNWNNKKYTRTVSINDDELDRTVISLADMLSEDWEIVASGDEDL